MQLHYNWADVWLPEFWSKNNTYITIKTIYFARTTTCVSLNYFLNQWLVTIDVRSFVVRNNYEIYFTYKSPCNPTKRPKSETIWLESSVYMKTISGKRKVLDNIKGRQRSTKIKMYAGQILHFKTLKTLKILLSICSIYVLRITPSLV